MPAKRTPEQIDEAVKGRPLTRVGEYRNYDTKIEWKCHQCDNIWEATPNNVITKGSGCPTCGDITKGKKKSAGQKDRITQHLTFERIELVTPYTRISDNHTFKCQTCSHTWTTALNNLVNAKSGCPACVGLNRLTNESIDQRLVRQGRKITRMTDAVNATTKIQWKCDKDHVWKATPDSVLNAGAGCSRCNRLGFQTAAYFKRNPHKRTAVGTLYLISCSDGCNRFLKVGITEGTATQRYRSQLQRLHVEIIAEVPMLLGQAFEYEQQFLRRWAKMSYVPVVTFGGKTECLTYQQEIIVDFMKYQR